LPGGWEKGIAKMEARSASKEVHRIVRLRALVADRVPSSGLGGADREARWILAFLMIGVAIRLIRYLLRFPLWGDEAMLATNFLDRDYAGLMQPLDFHQVAPLLFLWTELIAVKLFGFHEWSLRLFPLLCSLASLFLFHRLAKLVLRGTALVLAVGIFAVTYSGLRYAAETKPYGVDLMISTLLLLLAVRWWRSPRETRWLWLLAAFVPLALGISYPAVFVAGGVSLVVATVLPAVRSRHAWWAWGVYSTLLAGSFFGWYWLSTAAQAGAELGDMTRMWNDTFPPRGSLVSLLVWLVKVHAGPLLAVPVGGDHWGSIATTLLCLVAVGVLIRQGRYRLLVLCSSPFLLNLIAAALRRFPYGGHMRLAMHLTPLVCILAAIGATAILRRFRNSQSLLTGHDNPTTLRHNLCLVPPPRIGLPAFHDAMPAVMTTSGSPQDQPWTWPVKIIIGLLLLLAILSSARDFCCPGKEEQEIRKRDFAAWFWGTMERKHEVVSICGDLGEKFPPKGIPWQTCVSPQFLCNTQIYSPRHAKGWSYDFSRVSRGRSLLCVQYWSHFSPYDQVAFHQWIHEMSQRFDWIGTQNYPILQDNDDDRVPEPSDRIEVYEFVPKG
jgi:hypothetical protein